MSKLDELRKGAKIENPYDDAIADSFFGRKDAPGLYQMVSIDRIEPDPGNPRSSMNPDRLRQLADSIREKGIIHPLNLIELESGHYRVEEGHRRYAAARQAGLKSVPAIVKAGSDVSAEDVLERQLVENLHNEQLPPIDSALAIRKLMDDHQLSIRDVSRKISLPRSTVDEYLAILRIPEDLRSLPGVANLPKKALVLISRAPVERMAGQIRLALDSKTPWQTINRTRQGVKRTDSFNERIPLKSIPGSINMKLRRRPEQITQIDLAEAYLEASDLLRRRRKDLLAS